MKIEICYNYTKRGIISENFIEEHCSRYSVGEAMEAVSACLKDMRKNPDSALHVSADGKTLSVYPGSWEDFQQGIVKTKLSRAWNDSDAERLATFARLKRTIKTFLTENAVEEAA